MTFILRLLLVFSFLLSAPLLRGFSFYYTTQLTINADTKVAVIFCEQSNGKQVERVLADIAAFFKPASSKIEVSFIIESPFYFDLPQNSAKFDLATLARAPPHSLLS